MEISVNNLNTKFREVINELHLEPEFNWRKEKVKYEQDENGHPQIKVAIGNVPLNYDLWEGLRNPAGIGLYPATLTEIWEFYANRRKQKVDEYGRQTIFQTLRTFKHAQKTYKRAVIISTMLPYSHKILRDYNRLIDTKNGGSSFKYYRMFEDLNRMIDKAINRVSIDLTVEDNVVIGMDEHTTKDLSKESIPLTRRGSNHGPYKSSNNFPQKTVAAIMGLGQINVFGVICRDELLNGKVKRFFGPIRSIIMFDKEDLITDGTNDIIYPTKAWRNFLVQLYDFTNINPEINKYRFCTYIPYNDKGCGKCIKSCIYGAIANSVPNPNGKYSDHILKQSHRFRDRQLQFDGAKCLEERGQMLKIHPEWSCSNCVATCVIKGNRRKQTSRIFYEKTKQLTKLNPLSHQRTIDED